MFIEGFFRICRGFFACLQGVRFVFVRSIFRVCKGLFSCSEKVNFGFISNFLVFI